MASNFQVDGEKIPVAREGELYSLKWHTFQSHLATGLKQFLSEGEFLTDVTLVAEGRQLRSHRMLLSLCSPHFKQLFQGGGGGGPNTNTIVILNGVRYQDLQHVIQFIYNGEVKVSNNHELQGFLQTGELLQIEGLTKSGQNNETDEHSNSMPERHTPPQPHTSRRSQPASVKPGGIVIKGSPTQHSSSSPSFHGQFSQSQPMKTAAPPTKRPRYSAAAGSATAGGSNANLPTATVTSYNQSITPDVGTNETELHGQMEMDPLGLSDQHQPGGNGTEMMGMGSDGGLGQHQHSGDIDEEQMITIDSIKSEALVEDSYVHDDGDEEETFDMSEHGDMSNIEVGDVYGGAIGDESFNLPGPSSASGGVAVAGAGPPQGGAHQPAKPPGVWRPRRGRPPKKSPALFANAPPGLPNVVACNRRLSNGEVCGGKMFFTMERRNVNCLNGTEPYLISSYRCRNRRCRARKSLKHLGY